MSAADSKSIAIIGGGITGLTAAWRLHRAGYRITVFEKNPTVGGAISTTEQDGWLIEGGPTTLQQTPEIAALLTELGLENQRMVAHPAANTRFIVRSGRLIPAPVSFGSLLTSPLFSISARLRIFRELLMRPRVRATDTSLAIFFAAHFGREFLDYGLDPFVAGIYAGNPEKLSARYAFPRLWQLERTHGSLLRGLRAEALARLARGETGSPPPLLSFAHGLHTLPNALAAALPSGSIRTDTVVTNIISNRPWKIISNHHDEVETSKFDAIILALPASGLAELVFGTLGERTLATLDHQPHPPVSSLFLGLKRDQVAHSLDGFGALIPAREHRNLLGIHFSSSLFPGRAPAGHVALTVFAGGARQPETARLTTARLLARVLPDLRELLGVSGEPVFIHHRFWPKAIPQYNLGHERFLEPLTRCENQHPGLFIGGNARDGISLPDCLKSGTELARKTAEFLQKSPGKNRIF